MNKEEILTKSRQENKNRDIAEIDKFKNASRFAIIVSMCFIAVFTILSLLVKCRVNYGVIATEFSMIFSIHLYKAIKERTLEKIIYAVITGFVFAMFSWQSASFLASNHKAATL